MSSNKSRMNPLRITVWEPPCIERRTRNIKSVFRQPLWRYSFCKGRNRYKIFSNYQPCHLVKYYRRFGDHVCLHRQGPIRNLGNFQPIHTADNPCFSHCEIFRSHSCKQLH
jgi:hypothetical protein